MARIVPLAIALLLFAGCAGNPQPAGRSFTILSINDVYRIEGPAPGFGGLARVRSLRAELEQTSPDLLMMHGGDLLFPSLPSRAFNGAQMIDVLNHLDGVSPGFDQRMFVVFGNHEFDRSRMRHYPEFVAGIRKSEFSWLGTNIDFAPLDNEEPLAANLIDSTIVTSGGVRVGIFGLTLDVADIAYATFHASEPELRRRAQQKSRELRAAGAEFVVALTHLPVNTDARLLALDDGPDMIIGGHEHNRIDRTVNGRRLLKADADAVSARVTTVTLDPAGVPSVATEIRELVSPGVVPDAKVQARAQWWLHRHAAAFCSDLGKPDSCLDEPLAAIERPLVGEEILVRSEQTNLGDWVADLMLDSARQLAPQPIGVPMVAFVNSGALRLNQNLAAGSSFRRRHLEELIKYSDPLDVIRLTADELQQALDHSVSCREAGPWLQVAGLSFEADPVAGRASEIRVHGRPLWQIEQVYAVTTRFLANPDVPGDQDFYRFRADQLVETVMSRDGTAVELKTLLQQELAGPNGLSRMGPQSKERIRLLSSERRGGPGPLCSKQ